MNLHRRIVKLIGVIVPRRFRADWRQEWEAELQYREALLAEWTKLDWRKKLDLLRRSLGAFFDALWLQQVRLEDEVFQDLRYGLRVLAQNRSFTLIAVLALALGIGANTAMFSVVNGVLLRPLPYPESDKLLQIGRAFSGSNEVDDLSAPKFIFLRDNNRSFNAITATQGMGPDLYLSNDNQAEFVRGVRVTAEFFRALGVEPSRGRSFTAQEDSPGGERVVILGDQLWRTRFGADEGTIGQTIVLNGVSFTVIGVMPPGFEYNGPQDVLLPMRVNQASQDEGHNLTVIGRLRTGVTRDQARSESQLLFDKFSAAYPRQVYKAETFGISSWRAQMTRGVSELLWILLGAVGLVLLIACANVASLQLTRATSRQREMAIRMALGARGGRLLRQMLTEGVVLAFLGGSAGVLLAFWETRAMLALLPSGMLPRSTDISLDARVLVFAVAVSLLTAIVFSLAPALQALHIDVNRALKEGEAKTSAVRARSHDLLVVVEVALALTLTIGAGLLLRTFANLKGVEPGFEAHNVMTFEIAPHGKGYDSIAKLNDFSRRALERMRKLPGVKEAALTNKLPLDRWFNLPYRLGGQSDWNGSTEYRVISPDYFQVVKMTVNRGRPFNDADTAGAEPVVIINDAFARRNFANVDPLGQQLCIGCEYGDPSIRRVVGVVNDTRQRSLTETPPQSVFIPLAEAADGVRQAVEPISFVLSTAGNPTALGPAIEDEMRRLDPTTPVRNLRPLEELIDSSVAPQRFNLSLLSLFAGLGLLLAAVGIYGVIAYRVTRRTREIGIRMALGASSSDVLKLVVGQGMGLAVAGVALGLIASLFLTRLLRSLLFGVRPTDPVTFVVIALLLILVALMACYMPARRATKVNPFVALRSE